MLVLLRMAVVAFSGMFVLGLGLPPGEARAASFQGLGGLGVPTNTFAYGVSGDGSTAVGRSASAAGLGAFV